MHPTPRFGQISIFRQHLAPAGQPRGSRRKDYTWGIHGRSGDQWFALDAKKSGSILHPPANRGDPGRRTTLGASKGGQKISGVLWMQRKRRQREIQPRRNQGRRRRCGGSPSGVRLSPAKPGDRAPWDYLGRVSKGQGKSQVWYGAIPSFGYSSSSQAPKPVWSNSKFWIFLLIPSSQARNHKMD